MSTPYTGFTGVETPQQAQIIITQCETLLTRQRLLMLGVLVCEEPFTDHRIEHPNRYPPIETIEDIFVDDPRVLNLINFSTLKPENLAHQLVEMTELAGPHLNAFQLSLAWPPIGELANFRQIYPEIKIVLQIPPEAFKAINHSADELVLKLMKYEQFIDYILLDPSCGSGLRFDPERIKSYLQAIVKRGLNINIGAAGGYGPGRLSHLRVIAPEFPGISTDAERLLRDDNDLLVIAWTIQYLEESFQLLNC